jgi:hypothetical protein
MLGVRDVKSARFGGGAEFAMFSNGAIWSLPKFLIYLNFEPSISNSE